MLVRPTKTEPSTQDSTDHIDPAIDTKLASPFLDGIVSQSEQALTCFMRPVFLPSSRFEGGTTRIVSMQQESTEVGSSKLLIELETDHQNKMGVLSVNLNASDLNQHWCSENSNLRLNKLSFLTKYSSVNELNHGVQELIDLYIDQGPQAIFTCLNKEPVIKSVGYLQHKYMIDSDRDSSSLADEYKVSIGFLDAKTCVSVRLGDSFEVPTMILIDQLAESLKSDNTDQCYQFSSHVLELSAVDTKRYHSRIASLKEAVLAQSSCFEVNPVIPGVDPITQLIDLANGYQVFAIRFKEVGPALISEVFFKLDPMLKGNVFCRTVLGDVFQIDTSSISGLESVEVSDVQQVLNLLQTRRFSDLFLTGVITVNEDPNGVFWQSFASGMDALQEIREFAKAALTRDRRRFEMSYDECQHQFRFAYKYRDIDVSFVVKAGADKVTEVRFEWDKLLKLFRFTNDRTGRSVPVNLAFSELTAVIKDFENFYSLSHYSTDQQAKVLEQILRSMV